MKLSDKPTDAENAAVEGYEMQAERLAYLAKKFPERSLAELLKIHSTLSGGIKGE